MFKLQRAELSWSRLGPLLSPADYNITKRIIHKSCYHLSLTILVYLIYGILQAYLALSSPPCYTPCLPSLQPVRPHIGVLSSLLQSNFAASQYRDDTSHLLRLSRHTRISQSDTLMGEIFSAEKYFRFEHSEICNLSRNMKFSLTLSQ